MNITDHKYSCPSEVGAHFIMIFFSFIIIGTTFIIFFSEIDPMLGIRSTNITDHCANLFLSLAYTLSLPIMSYMFSKSHKNNQESKSQLILIWMVFTEMICIFIDPIFTWRLRKSAEQLVRLFWVAFLVYTYLFIQKNLRACLFILCIYFVFYEVMKVILFHIAKNSYLIGKNPKVIHNYMKRIFLQDDLQTTPMDSCGYIVMGEEHHEIAVCSNGFVLGKKKSNSEVLTIGRVFQLNPSGDANHYWRDTCLSLALAKMLRRRFTKLPVDEAGCEKALDFVREGLIINYIGTNQDIQTDGNDGEIYPERVFSIIREELKFVSEFLHMKVLIYYYSKWSILVDIIGLTIVLVVSHFSSVSFGSYTFTLKSFVEREENNPCFFLILGHGSVVPKIVYRMDEFITISLVGSSFFFLCSNVIRSWYKSGNILSGTDPAKWKKKNRLLIARGNIDKEARDYFSVLDVSIFVRLPKCIHKVITRSSSTVIPSDAKRSILNSLRNNGGRLTKGETSLKNYRMEHLNWACPPNGSTTEAILVWHIATILFYHQKPSPDQISNDPHPEPSPQDNNNPFKEQKVALALSSYCLYLVADLPELLPDEVESTKEMYGSVTKEILARPQCFFQKSTKKDRCNYVLETTWGENSVVGKGVKLANDLVNCANDGSLVWTMLAEFWAELMLFVAPSDNVDGHEQILERTEFITQLWALLTHAGIVTRPKPTEHQDHHSESNAVSGEINV